MKLKPIEVKNYAYGTVRIVDPSTQGAASSDMPTSTSDTKTAWHIYGFSVASKEARESATVRAGEETLSSFCIYLPSSCLMYNNEVVLVDPIHGGRGGNDFYDIGNTRGDITCSIYRDGLAYKAKIGVGVIPGAVQSFLVCSVGGTDKSISVSQYVSGMVSLYAKSSVDNAIAGPFAPIIEEESEGSEESGEERVIGYENCYWMSGGVLRTINDQHSPGDDGFVALREGATPDTIGTASLVIYSDIAALQEAQQDPAYFIIPLYKMEGGLIALDLRSTPQSQMAEVL